MIHVFSTVYNMGASLINPLKDRGVKAIGHPGLTYIFNFWHSGTVALRAERHSARMSEIKNVC